MFVGDGRVEDEKESGGEEMGQIIMRNSEIREFPVEVNLLIPNSAGPSPNPACNDTVTRSSQNNQASRTPDFSYPLIFSTLFSSSSPSLSFSSTTQPSSQNTKLSHPSLSLHVMIMS
jgi:hypothetical protein